MNAFFDHYAAWMPLMIFCARITDVSLGTFRTICVVRGMKLVAACIGFFEILIWLGAISNVVTRLNQPLNVIAYAAGFATGNWIGTWLEGKIALGQQIVRMISTRDAEHMLASRLREAGYVVTEMQGQGRDAPMDVCFIAAMRRDVPALLETAKRLDPDVFCTVEDVREISLRPRHYVNAPPPWWSIIKKK